jgi:hypothetical protein
VDLRESITIADLGDVFTIPANTTVDLPAERDLAIREKPAFLALRQEVEDLVRAQHRQHLA